MLLRWLRKRRRRRLMAEPYPTEWLNVLESDVAHYALLPDDLQTRLRAITQVFIAEKEWEGVGGIDITAEMQVTIAALAGILILGQDDFYFDNVFTILVTPAGYRTRRREPLAGHAYLEGMDELLGEADHHGPIKLAWSEVATAARAPGYGENLVFHEFAHKIDMLGGEATGTPPMPNNLIERWDRVMKREYDALYRAAKRGHETVLDPYGATNEAEFFAVASETFFDHPLALRAAHVEMYELLRDFYRLDPALWFEKHTAA